MSDHLTYLADWLDRETESFACLDALAKTEGRDMSRVIWRFLGAILRELAEQEPRWETIIDPVIVGMDLLASGADWLGASNAWHRVCLQADAANAGPEVAPAAFAAWAPEGGPAGQRWAALQAARRAAAVGVPIARQREILLQLMEDAK